jgi:hypothetical protein
MVVGAIDWFESRFFCGKRGRTLECTWVVAVVVLGRTGEWHQT